MKSSHAALALIGLLLAGLWFVGGGSTPVPPSAAAAEQVRVSEPVAHDNLTVYFVHGPDAVENAKVATLQEASRRRLGGRPRDRGCEPTRGREPLERSRALHPGGGHHQGRQAGSPHRHRHAPAAELRPRLLPGPLRGAGAVDETRR